MLLLAQFSRLRYQLFFRLGVVVFGGDGVFDEPRSIVLNNEFSDLFTPLLFDNIPVGTYFLQLTFTTT
jgi:hypothetical protein